MNKNTYNVVSNEATTNKEMLSMANDIYAVINESTTASEELRTAVKSVFEKHGLAVVRSFRDYSLNELSEMIDEGNASKLLNVGDERDIKLITGEKITVVILGFDHDEKADGSGKAAITLGLKNLMDGDLAMNLKNKNEGGWGKSRMRTIYMQRIFKLFPEEWQNIIVPVRKRTSIGGCSQVIAEMEDKLFLFSVAEIFSSSAIKESDWSTISDNAEMYNAEGKQYAYYAGLIGDADPDDTQELLVKRSSNGSGLTNAWWLRSAYPTTSAGFHCIGCNGCVDSDTASNSFGVCFGFCI